MVASEAAPFVKTGGLADVLGSLPAALVKKGDEVAVVLPRFRSAVIDSSERIWHAMPLSVGPHRFVVAIDQVVRQGVRYLFVDCPVLYDRPGLTLVGWGTALLVPAAEAAVLCLRGCYSLAPASSPRAGRGRRCRKA